MGELVLSRQGEKLLEFYTQMAEEGYARIDGNYVENAFSDFEIRKFRNVVQPFLAGLSVTTLLDYGSGGSDWHLPGFDTDTNASALEFFSLKTVTNYEPARDRDGVRSADCVTCIDVLEHIFISDLPAALRDIFSLATSCVVLNVACYDAAAQLPNGENAHISVRDPQWWKGMVDTIAMEFPDIQVLLICSTTYTSGVIFEPWETSAWHESDVFTVPPARTQLFGNGPWEVNGRVEYRPVLAAVQAGVKHDSRFREEIAKLISAS